MNYKNIIAFILLIFTVGCVEKVPQLKVEEVSPPQPPVWLQLRCKEADAFYKKIADSYTKYVDSKGIKRTIIVGSGRGWFNRNYDKFDNYAVVAYNKPHNYLLVNYCHSKFEREILPEVRPDIVADVTAMNPEIFGANQYDYIIFENIPMWSSFTKEAVQGAFLLLKKGGKIVSSGVPSLRSKDSQDFKRNKQCSSETFVFGEGTPEGGVFFHPKNEKCTDELIPWIFVDKNKYKVYPHEDLSFYKNNVQDLFRFFGLNPAEAKIEFTTVMPDTEEWPSRDEGGISTKQVMIITKK